MPLKMAVTLADALVQLRWESGRPRRQQAGKPRFSRACPTMRGSVGSVTIETRSVSIKNALTARQRVQKLPSPRPRMGCGLAVLCGKLYVTRTIGGNHGPS